MKDWNDERWLLQNQSHCEEEKDQQRHSKILAHNETVNKRNCQVVRFSKKAYLPSLRQLQGNKMPDCLALLNSTKMCSSMMLYNIDSPHGICMTGNISNLYYTNEFFS